MVARDGAQVRGATLSSDERLNQLEELLSKFEFVGMSRAVENAYLPGQTGEDHPDCVPGC